VVLITELTVYHVYTIYGNTHYTFNSLGYFFVFWKRDI